MLRAVISAVAEKGLAATTVAEIVRRARVSRQAFYHQFNDKEACLIAAVDVGIDVIVSAITATLRIAAGLSSRELLSLVVEEYLRTCAAEPEFVRAWVVDLPMAGAAGVVKRNQYLSLLADFLRDAHLSASSEVPERQVLIAAVGGCHELFYRHITEDVSSSYTDLHPPIMTFLDRVLPPPSALA